MCDSGRMDVRKVTKVTAKKLLWSCAIMTFDS
jgi:hypothetical protein